MTLPREIKFRGLDKEGAWVYGFVYQAGNRTFIFDGVPYEVRPETVGQWTGLKDKGGVDVFEGDVLKFGRFALNDVGRFGEQPWKHLPEGVRQDDITTQIGSFITVEWDIKKLELLRQLIESNPDVDGVEIIGTVHTEESK